MKLVGAAARNGLDLTRTAAVLCIGRRGDNAELLNAVDTDRKRVPRNRERVSEVLTDVDAF